MVTIDLGAFAEAYDNNTLRGAPRTLNGKINGDRVVPYPKRDSITPFLGQIIGYAHPADVYNLQVQGSGRLSFQDGTQARAQFSAQNGYKWNSALGALRNSGRLASPTWANFRSWLDTNPGEQKTALNADPSYVFFQEETIPDYTAGPRGAANVPLTPMGSIAVDPAFHPYGALVFVDATYDGNAFDRLFREYGLPRAETSRAEANASYWPPTLGASAQVDYLVESLFEPNKKIKENYHSLVVADKDGIVHTGIKLRETDKDLILRDAENRELAIPLDNIEEQANGGSLMPVGGILTSDELALIEAWIDGGALP